MPDTWTSTAAHLDDLQAIEGAIAVLSWDQQTMLPRKGAGARGAQLAALSKVYHERATDPRVGQWLQELDATELDRPRKATTRLLRKQFERSTKVPTSLVVALAEAQSAGFEAWVKAKQASDFSIFAPHLERLLDLTREKIRALDPDSHPYDVLLDEFDPGTTVASLRTMFARLRDGLVPLIAAIGARPQIPGLTGTFDVAAQRALHHDVIAALGYDGDAGRLDDAEHPFTIGMTPGDVRITTHFYADDLLSGLGGTIHECGHALYEQGLPTDLPGAAIVGKAASFGLHESQSRFWENAIGRSRPFCRWLAAKLAHRFPGQAIDPEVLYRACNRVQPGLIRIKADEVTYNLHIIVRFEIELALFEGKLAVKDLPAAWNAKMKAYLGVEPPDDAHGVLQDVHWSSAAFGYFPSYTLGNLYAVGFLRTMEQQLPGMWDDVENGRFDRILGWLRANVHAHGSLDEAPDRVKAVIGDRDLVADLLDYLWTRHGAVYGVSPR
jgi:carboxypeptidase Taq